MKEINFHILVKKNSGDIGQPLRYYSRHWIYVGNVRKTEISERRAAVKII